MTSNGIAPLGLICRLRRLALSFDDEARFGNKAGLIDHDRVHLEIVIHLARLAQPEG